MKYRHFSGTSYITILLFFATSAIHLYSIQNKFSFWCIILQSFCSYVMFTILHDAVHGSISTEYKILNNVFGWISQIWMGPTANFYAFKYLHLNHHKYVNIPGKDPDYWVSHWEGSLKFFLYPFVDIGYWRYYIPEVLPWNPKRPGREVFIVWLYHITIFLFIIIAFKYNFGYMLILNWFIPARISKFLLAFLFDYLPHKNITITKKENKYKTTHYLSFSNITRPFATLILFYQNYHISHHAYPRDPFWRYKTHYKFHKKEMENSPRFTIL